MLEYFRKGSFCCLLVGAVFIIYWVTLLFSSFSWYLQKVDYPLELDVYEFCSEELRQKLQAPRQVSSLWPTGFELLCCELQICKIFWCLIVVKLHLKMLRDIENAKLGLKTQDKSNASKVDECNMPQPEVRWTLPSLLHRRHSETLYFEVSFFKSFLTIMQHKLPGHINYQVIFSMFTYLVITFCSYSYICALFYYEKKLSGYSFPPTLCLKCQIIRCGWPFKFIPC